MIADVRRQFAELQAVPFPPTSANELVDELHAELAEYDGYVAGVATTLFEDGYKPDRPFARDFALIHRIRSAAGTATGDVGQEMTVIADYAARLDRLAAALAAHLARD